MHSRSLMPVYHPSVCGKEWRQYSSTIAMLFIIRNEYISKLATFLHYTSDSLCWTDNPQSLCLPKQNFFHIFSASVSLSFFFFLVDGQISQSFSWESRILRSGMQGSLQVRNCVVIMCLVCEWLCSMQTPTSTGQTDCKGLKSWNVNVTAILAYCVFGLTVLSIKFKWYQYYRTIPNSDTTSKVYHHNLI